MDSLFDGEDLPAALGSVVEVDRGSLPFELIHGEPLVVCATWALEEAGVTPVDFPTTWTALAESGEPFVLHDALCPMTPVDFVARCVATAVERETVVVGVRPVTDTVKEVRDATLGATVDRDGLLAVASPIVLPAAVVDALDELPSTDFAALTSALARRFPVLTLEAPAPGRRVTDAEDVRLLEAQTAPDRAGGSAG